MDYAIHEAGTLIKPAELEALLGEAEVFLIPEQGGCDRDELEVLGGKWGEVC